MNKYMKNPTFEDFLSWCKNNPQAKEFYEEFILDIILDLEGDDYFGIEGFNKRYS